MDFDESAASIDFDSSMPDGSFGDLPLSEATDTKGKPKISFLKGMYSDYFYLHCKSISL